MTPVQLLMILNNLSTNVLINPKIKIIGQKTSEGLLIINRCIKGGPESSQYPEKIIFWSISLSIVKRILGLALIAFARTRTVYVVFQSRGFCVVPRVLIAEARSFQTFAAILD